MACDSQAMAGTVVTPFRDNGHLSQQKEFKFQPCTLDNPYRGRAVIWTAERLLSQAAAFVHD